jgi:hypothetical protein
MSYTEQTNFRLVKRANAKNKSALAKKPRQAVMLEVKEIELSKNWPRNLCNSTLDWLKKLVKTISDSLRQSEEV